MTWKMSTEEHRGHTITIQVCTNPELEEGDIITVEIGRVEERFESLDECKTWLDEQADEEEYRAERAYQDRLRLTSLNRAFWY